MLTPPVPASDQATDPPALARPDLASLAAGIAIATAADLPAGFTVDEDGIRLRADLRDAPAVLRHALEIAILRRLWPGEPALVGLAAARVAALFTCVEGDERAADPRFAAPTPPDISVLRAAWSRLAYHQPRDRGAPVTAAIAARLAALWPILGTAEHLLTAGGDSRLRVDPVSRLNAYGCSPSPRPWAITFASTTATSISELAYDAVEACRRRVLAADPATAWQAETASIRRAILDHYGLTAGDAAVVLTPSGTDGELCALAVHRLGGAAAPSVNLLIAPEETGTGVVLAAAGRHFAEVTALGVAVAKGGPIDGLGEHVEIAAAAIRALDGAVRATDAIDADVARIADQAVAGGRRVLVHILDVSKTGLLAPSGGGVAALARRHGTAVDVLVDACQARLSAASLRDYLAAGYMVLITGSKFFTGPPFSGALLLPPAIAARLVGGRLPSGLAAYVSGLDWPSAGGGAMPVAVNHGLVLRWTASLAEMRAFAAVPPALCRHVIDSFCRRIADAIAANPDLVPHAAPPPARARDDWDARQTVFSFSVRAPGGGLLDLDALRRLYRALNRDLSPLIGGSASLLAARCCHIGQPVALGGAHAALRLAAGARLVSGVHGDPALGPTVEVRLAREIADACLALDKISLVLRHADLLSAAERGG